MNVTVRKYEEKDLPDLIRIWNEVVEDGVAFPQEECLNEETGKAFFSEQTYTAAALAYIFYLKGIDTGIDLSLVGVLASVELVISSVLGWTILSEDFSFIKLFGVCLMMVSAYIATKSSSDESVQDEYETAC